MQAEQDDGYVSECAAALLAQLPQLPFAVLDQVSAPDPSTLNPNTGSGERPMLALPQVPWLLFFRLGNGTALFLREF